MSVRALCAVRQVGSAICRAQPLRMFSASRSPLDLMYSQDHEWVKVTKKENTRIATIGISAHAVEALGDIVYVELPKLDECYESGEVIGSVESVKSVSDVFAPVSGKIIELNEKAREKPGMISQKPESTGWIVKMELTDKADEELAQLMTEEDYMLLN